MTTTEKKQFEALKNEVERLTEKVKQLENPMIYNYIDKNMPEWAKEAVRFFCEKGILVGTGNGLNLSDTKLWMLVILYRVIRNLL